jgi:hypothetical protein
MPSTTAISSAVRGGPHMHLELESPAPEGATVGIYQVVGVSGSLRETSTSANSDPRTREGGYRLESTEHETVGTLVCLAPCDIGRPYPLERELFVGGPGLAQSPNFRIDEGRRDSVVLSVKPGKKSQFDAGVGLIAVGASFTLGGIALAPASTGTNPSPAFRPLTASFLVGGTALLATGVALVVTGRVRVSSPSGGVSF